MPALAIYLPRELENSIVYVTTQALRLFTIGNEKQQTK